jgi:DNA-binding phage protein
MARRMGTSRTQLDRLLDPANHSVTLATIVKAATAIGKKISIRIEENLPAKMA